LPSNDEAAEPIVPLQPGTDYSLTSVEVEELFHHANKTTIYKLRKAELVQLVCMKVQSLEAASLEEVKKMKNDNLRVLLQNEVTIFAYTIPFRC
jgi:hypothetical protein